MLVMLPLRRQFGVERFRTAHFSVEGVYNPLLHPSPLVAVMLPCSLCPFVCNAPGKDQQLTVLHGPASHPPGTHLAVKLVFLPAASDLYRQMK